MIRFLALFAAFHAALLGSGNALFSQPQPRGLTDSELVLLAQDRSNFCLGALANEYVGFAPSTLAKPSSTNAHDDGQNDAPVCIFCLDGVCATGAVPDLLMTLAAKPASELIPFLSQPPVSLAPLHLRSRSPPHLQNVS